MKATNVIIVEDEALIAFALQVQLESLGCRVIKKAASGEAAIEAYGRLDPSDADAGSCWALIDIKLAGELDGVETARRMLSRRPLPIAFMTAYGDPALKDRALELSPIAYLFKPLEEGALAGLLDRLA